MMPPRLEDALFLHDSGTRQVFDALGRDPDVVRIVGGAVRNALLGHPVAEVDFATVLEPQEVVAKAEGVGLKTVPTGIEHGTVTLIADGRPFEVTTLRADVETDGRRAVVRFSMDWEEDAQRRDFTINALYCAADGTIFDPLGGYRDIESRTVRFVGDAEDRIREDYLRILRFFRFFAWYGGGRPDAEGLKASARLKAGLSTLSAERVWSELKRLLSAPEPQRALLWMRTTEVLKKILPECWGIDAIHRLVTAEQAEGWHPDPMLRLEAIIPPHHARIDSLFRRLKLSRAEGRRLSDWADAPEIAPDLPESEFAKLVYRAGKTGILDRLRLALAREREAGNEAAREGLMNLIAFAARWERPVLPVSGRDLIAAGAEPGPDLGERLRALEDRWVESGFSLDRNELIGNLSSNRSPARDA